MRLHFREYGQGTPLVLLHGLFGSLDNWVGIARNLADRYHVFVVDQRNHGNSPHEPEMNYAVMSEDLREFMKAHGLRSTHLLGHSMGGKTAMTLALSHPEMVSRLVVVDIAPRQYPRKHDYILDALLALDLGAYRTRSEIEQALAPTVPSVALRRFLLKGVRQEPEGGLRWKFNLAALQNNYAELGAAVESSGTFEKPTLFLRGEKSDYVSAEDLPQIQRLFPRVEVVTIPDAGHWLHAEAPEIFLKHVREFLQPRFSS